MEKMQNVGTKSAFTPLIFKNFFMNILTISDVQSFKNIF